MAYDNRNQGVLFKNDKGDNDRRPDYRGNINVNGTEYELSAWIKASKAGAKYMSLSVQPKRERAPESAAQTERPPVAPEFNDEIPF